MMDHSSPVDVYSKVFFDAFLSTAVHIVGLLAVRSCQYCICIPFVFVFVCGSRLIFLCQRRVHIVELPAVDRRQVLPVIDRPIDDFQMRFCRV